MPAFLFRQEEPVSYILKAWPLALVPALVLAIVVGIAVPQAEPPALEVDGVAAFFLLVAFAPSVETLLMTPPLLLAARFLGPGPAVVASAVLWGVLHSLSAPVWGLVAWWPFLVLSVALLTWRGRGLAWAMLMVASIHALHNSVPAALMLLAG